MNIMRCVIGLGNPGEKYAHTRHNIGWMILDAIQQKSDFTPFSFQKKVNGEISKNQEILLLKPQTFMNDSGQSARTLLDFYQIELQAENLEWVFVIHDDLDIQLGKYKVQFGKGPKVHNGLLSLYDHLKTDQFWHVRVGVDGREGDRSLPGHQYVLQQFMPAELRMLNQVIDDCSSEVIQRLTDRLQ